MSLEPDALLIPLFTTSAVLLGITFATVNFTHSILINPVYRNEDLILNGLNYKVLLERNAKYLIAAGIIFAGNIIFILTSICIEWAGCLNYSIYAFIIGCLLVSASFLSGRIKPTIKAMWNALSNLFNSPISKKPPEIE